MNQLVDSIRQKKPLVHCISNIVSANDCANLLLALGASPIMAQAPEEMCFVTAAASALVLNTGTPSWEKFEACRAAGLAANSKGIPVILDPVGVGASPWRLDQVSALLRTVTPTLIRANSGEAKALLGQQGNELGVDSVSSDAESAARYCKALAEKYQCTVLLSGTQDLISDGQRILTVSGGSSLMKQVTGAGCMLSALCGAFAAVTAPLQAAFAAASLWKATAEAAEKQSGAAGLGSFRTALFDIISHT